jgi:hypothetical protein
MDNDLTVNFGHLEGRRMNKGEMGKLKKKKESRERGNNLVTMT